MDSILKYHFENLYWMRMTQVTIESKKRTFEGWSVEVKHVTEWGVEDETIEVPLEDMFDATAHMMENLK